MEAANNTNSIDTKSGVLELFYIQGSAQNLAEAWATRSGTKVLEREYASQQPTATNHGGEIEVSGKPAHVVQNSCRRCTGQVKVFGDDKFGGWFAPFAKGTYNYWAFRRGGARNDAVSSLQVPEGCKAILYQHGQFTGWKAIFRSGDFDLAKMLAHGAKDNDASSIKVVDEGTNFEFEDPDAKPAFIFDGGKRLGNSKDIAKVKAAKPKAKPEAKAKAAKPKAKPEAKASRRKPKAKEQAKAKRSSVASRTDVKLQKCVVKGNCIWARRAGWFHERRTQHTGYREVWVSTSRRRYLVGTSRRLLATTTASNKLQSGYYVKKQYSYWKTDRKYIADACSFRPSRPGILRVASPGTMWVGGKHYAGDNQPNFVKVQPSTQIKWTSVENGAHWKMCLQDLDSIEPRLIVDNSLRTCASLQHVGSWMAVDLGQRVAVTQVKLVMRRVTGEWGIRVAETLQEPGALCFDSSSKGVVATKMRSSTCVPNNDRVQLASLCAATADQTLPTGRYVKLVHLSHAEASTFCDLKVYGLKDDGSLNSAAATSSLKSISFAKTQQFKKALSNLGMRNTEAFAVKVTGRLKVPIISSGKYEFTVISDDGSVLYVNGKLIANNDGVHQLRSRSGSVELNDGWNDIELKYFQQSSKMGLMLQWSGGPYNFARTTFSFSPDWKTLEKEQKPPSCTLRMPEMNEAGVPIKWGLTRCHFSCGTCIPRSSEATDCTSCKNTHPFHTIINPRMGAGTCTEEECPLCKPKECCGEGHKHFIIDSTSMNGVCLRHTDDCKAHCVTNSRGKQVCSKGCNDLIKTASRPKMQGLLGEMMGQPKSAGNVFNIVVCQAEKLVECAPAPSKAKLDASMPAEYAVVRAPTKAEKQCTQQKKVACKAVCPDMDDTAGAIIWTAGGSCVLDVLNKLQCDRAPNNKCVVTEAGAYVCSRVDRSPYACGPKVSKFVTESVSCSCSSQCSGIDTAACRVVAMSF